MPSISLKPQLINSGYYTVSLYSQGKRKHASIHRLVAESFIPNTENKRCVNHLNGIKTDNRSCNLEWANHSDNLIHAYNRGLNKNKGTGHSNSKFSKKDVEDIRFLLEEQKMQQKDIAKKYCVSKSVITDLKQGNTYNDISFK